MISYSNSLTKVKGHATAEDVHRGTALPEDRQGNDAADNLAVAGALANGRKEVSQRLQAQMAATMDLQRMMVAILQIRGTRRQGASQDVQDGRGGMGGEEGSRQGEASDSSRSSSSSSYTSRSSNSSSSSSSSSNSASTSASSDSGGASDDASARGGPQRRRNGGSAPAAPD